MSTESLKTITGKRIILGVTGGIAAYKIAELVRLFKKAGAEVQVLMTPNAEKFVTPLTLGTLSEREILTGIFPENETGSWTKHVALGLWGDLYVIAPATAQTMAKLATGMVDSMLTAVALAGRCPVLICPAMDHDMYEHGATQKSLSVLRDLGYEVMEARHGELASGLIGLGRLPEPQEIFDRAVDKLHEIALERQGELAGKKVLVSAGPTREAIDPVRFISNHSTGTMGYEIAAAAARRGADVILVSGPTSLDVPHGVNRVDVVTAAEMFTGMKAHSSADYTFMVAAVADFRPTAEADSKIKKDAGFDGISVEPTTDILASLGAAKNENQVLVGFAMETEDAVSNARSKLERKNLDWIVVNDLREPGAGFGTGTNAVTILGRDGSESNIPVMAKREIAEALLDHVLADLR
ncbi:MAG: bifunctional phosphopantothenoylcysteine decarboxylase/phosphopantothenate--cysteine ligase CoaBC [Bacteroidetes bacterium]|nr:MAG: bifunctional phosphopantothenoylcysteine decarboxylase/phosphopantothenate--cysteine ligase CoaBC [Bacteroidota bacterium]